MTTTPLSRDGRVRVVVATTVLLSFISFWRAAAIVLADLGSTAFYVGGVRKSKPKPVRHGAHKNTAQKERKDRRARKNRREKKER